MVCNSRSHRSFIWQFQDPALLRLTVDLLPGRFSHQQLGHILSSSKYTCPTLPRTRVRAAEEPGELPQKSCFCGAGSPHQNIRSILTLHYLERAHIQHNDLSLTKDCYGCKSLSHRHLGHLLRHPQSGHRVAHRTSCKADNRSRIGWHAAALSATMYYLSIPDSLHHSSVCPEGFLT